MAGALTARILCAVLLLAVTGTLAAAQGLIDPTRPPAEFLMPTGNAAAVAVPAAGGGQVIILSSSRKEVTANGQTSKLGGKLGDATVVGITDSEVTTRNGGLIEKIRLYGNIEKRTGVQSDTKAVLTPRQPRGITK